jgi:hypothetical protein
MARAEQLRRQRLDSLGRCLRLNSIERETRPWRANLPVVVTE